MYSREKRDEAYLHGFQQHTNVFASIFLFHRLCFQDCCHALGSYFISPFFPRLSILFSLSPDNMHPTTKICVFHKNMYSMEQCVCVLLHKIQQTARLRILVMSLTYR